MGDLAHRHGHRTVPCHRLPKVGQKAGDVGVTFERSLGRRPLDDGVEGGVSIEGRQRLGVEGARADWNLDGPGQIVAASSAILDRVWTADGKSYRVGPGLGFVRDVEWADLPIPAGQIKLFADGIIVSVDDRVWAGAGSDGWEYVGQFSGPVSLRHESWGKVKARHR